ncbi:hypothetical protein TNCV_2504191 [Trichonephila clavipes]|nr:hypothetical protein TNCV_2504191 [Trichonephila clavipes]
MVSTQPEVRLPYNSGFSYQRERCGQSLPYATSTSFQSVLVEFSSATENDRVGVTAASKWHEKPLLCRWYVSQFDAYVEYAREHDAVGQFPSSAPALCYHIFTGRGVLRSPGHSATRADEEGLDDGWSRRWPRGSTPPGSWSFTALKEGVVCFLHTHRASLRCVLRYRPDISFYSTYTPALGPSVGLLGQGQHDVRRHDVFPLRWCLLAEVESVRGPLASR